MKFLKILNENTGLIAFLTLLVALFAIITTLIFWLVNNHELDRVVDETLKMTNCWNYKKAKELTDSDIVIAPVRIRTNYLTDFYYKNWANIIKRLSEEKREKYFHLLVDLQKGNFAINEMVNAVPFAWLKYNDGDDHSNNDFIYNDELVYKEMHYKKFEIDQISRNIKEKLEGLDLNEEYCKDVNY